MGHVSVSSLLVELLLLSHTSHPSINGGIGVATFEKNDSDRNEQSERDREKEDTVTKGRKRKSVDGTFAVIYSASYTS